MHIIFSILINLAKFIVKIYKIDDGAETKFNPANPVTKFNPENLARNFTKIARNLCQSIKTALN